MHRYQIVCSRTISHSLLSSISVRGCNTLCFNPFPFFLKFLFFFFFCFNGLSRLLKSPIHQYSKLTPVLFQVLVDASLQRCKASRSYSSPLLFLIVTKQLLSLELSSLAVTSSVHLRSPTNLHHLLTICCHYFLNHILRLFFLYELSNVFGFQNCISSFAISFHYYPAW